MGKIKIPDSELIEKLRDEKYTSYYAIAKAFDLVGQTAFIKRCHKLEELHNIPKREQSKHSKTKPTIKPPEVTKSKVAITGFPFSLKDQVYLYGERCTVICATSEKAELRNNRDMSHVTLTMEEYIQNPNIIRQIGEKAPITTTGEAIVLKQKDKKPDTEFNLDLEMDNLDLPFTEIEYTDEEWYEVKKEISEADKVNQLIDLAKSMHDDMGKFMRLIADVIGKEIKA